MTDIHVEYGRRADAGFRHAIRQVNALEPDFVITGGDLIMDALGQTYSRADSLYNLFQEIEKEFTMPVHHTMGNHEMFGVYTSSGVSPDHPDYGKTLFMKRLNNGKRYRSFDHEGWHFILLDGVAITPERTYIGEIDTEQLEWLASDLEGVGKETPVVMSVHIPFFTMFTQIREGALARSSPGLVIGNAKEVWELIEPYNVRLVLQGHLHVVEELVWKGTHFVTGGAVSGAWWTGSNFGFAEGFVVVDVKGDQFTWTYQETGWNAAP
jgi:3',5'-cyclic AMP phosphodiesterase CpdA